uniref:Uncharacterized protein n=2 Tax=Brassica oleracea TaxID=3712 RepID=A0A0D3A7H1_BRAOL
MGNGQIGLIAQLNKNRRCRGLNNVDQMLPQFFRKVNLFQMTMKTFLKDLGQEQLLFNGFLQGLALVIASQTKAHFEGANTRCLIFQGIWLRRCSVEFPVTSLRPVRSTCKKWNRLSKCGVFAKKHLAHQAKVAEEAKGPLVVMLMDYRVYLIRFNLSNINNNVESCVKREAKLIGPDGSDQIDVCEIFFIATVYCYAFPKTHLGSLFGTLIGQLYVCSRPDYLVDNYMYALGFKSALTNSVGDEFSGEIGRRCRVVRRDPTKLRRDPTKLRRNSTMTRS